MKIIMVMIMLLGWQATVSAQTWDEWFRQKRTQRKYLLQQIAKLQVYLGYVKQGYQIAKDGLDLIGDIKNGDFRLHETFIEDKKRVKPIISDDTKVRDIYRMARLIEQLCAKLRQLYTNAGIVFTSRERSLFDGQQSLMLVELNDDLNDLHDTIADYYLEMSDKERLDRITIIYQSVSDKKNWIQHINQDIIRLINQRQKLLFDNRMIERLYGL